MLVVVQAILAVGCLGYNAQIAQEMAYMAAITHCSKESILAWNCAKCKKFPLTDVIYLNNDVFHSMGFMGYSPVNKHIFLLFRGSDDTKNWIEDLTYDQVPFAGCAGCMVHSGFWATFVSLQKAIGDAAAKLHAKYNVPLIVGGHSLGGAISTHAALYLAKSYKIAEMINFGCPRVGNPAFAKYTREKIPALSRVVHYKDLVPHLPPEVMGFRHPPTEVFYDEPFKTFVLCDGSGQDKNCSDKFAPAFSTSDHDLYFIPQSC